MHTPPRGVSSHTACSLARRNERDRPEPDAGPCPHDRADCHAVIGCRPGVQIMAPFMFPRGRSFRVQVPACSSASSSVDRTIPGPARTHGDKPSRRVAAGQVRVVIDAGAGRHPHSVGSPPARKHESAQAGTRRKSSHREPDARTNQVCTLEEVLGHLAFVPETTSIPSQPIVHHDPAHQFKMFA
jgi:hypothetical protein